MPDKVEKAINEVLKGLSPSSESLICDYGIEEQNRALETQGKVPKADPKKLPSIGENVTYVVAAVVISERGEVLMMQEAKKSCAGKWYLPAGRLERGEDIETAAEREVKEETGLDIKCTSLILIDSGKGVWFRFVLVGHIIGGELKTPSGADKESLQAKWIKNLDEVPLRANDIIPLIERAREYKMAKDSGDKSWHNDILPSRTPHSRAYMRLVILIRKKRNNKVHVLLSERTTWHLPICEINPGKSVHSTLHSFMVEIFGADVASHRPHGILSDARDSMDSLWNTVDINHNIVRLLNGREVDTTHGRFLRDRCQFTPSLLKRLYLAHNLVGHQGCVNCLQWSSDGRQLASGSDDTVVRIWDPFMNKCLNVVPTKHYGNIFSVKFVGDGNLIATCAADYHVIVQSIVDSDSQVLMECTCHSGRVKRLAIAPDCPTMFWSAGEDGLIIQYDLREPHECSKNGTAFLDHCGTTEFKCIAVNPTKPHLIAIGANDAYVRLYDRRFVKTSKINANGSTYPRSKRAPTENPDPNCVQYFAPGHLARDNGGSISFQLVATYVAFDSSGRDLLVNMGGDHIYLYDINNNRHSEELIRLDWIPKQTPANSNVLKECCKIAAEFPNYEMPSKTSYSTHKHSYKFDSENPCACDYLARGRHFLRRKYIGDAYYAARDFLHVIKNWPNTVCGYLGLIECLIALKWSKEALAWVTYYQQTFPAFANDKNFKKLKEDMKLLDEKLLVDEVMTDVRVKVAISSIEKALRLDSRDYEYRYLGHCNTTTDIKEANFMGNDGNFICAGSDDGMIFIWDRKTTNLMTALVADDSIVNCVQPHPSICCLASSGIDSEVKIWSPMSEDVENVKNCSTIKDLWTAMEGNQDRMLMDPFDTILINMFREVRSERSASGDVTQATCRTS